MTTSDLSYLADQRSFSLYSDPSSTGLLSAESSDAGDRTSAILSLATESPDRFLSLVAHLTPIIQDILIQYYLLGRTLPQIGAVLFPGGSGGRGSQRQWATRGHAIGIRAIAILVRCGSAKAAYQLDPSSSLGAMWHDMLRWRVGTSLRQRATTTIRAPRDLGDFVIAPNGQLGELFAPSWSVLCPASSTGEGN